jgi:PAS domain S-box-containing protein
MSLKFLILEDSSLDTELIAALLLESGIKCELIQAKTRPEFQAALERVSFDLILSDYSLPDFDGISALEMAQQLCPDIPFIFVTATMGEEIAIETLKRGATDYVLKQRLERLVPAVQRSLREAEQRRARVAAETELYRREQEFRALVENSPDIIARYDRELRHLYINPAVERITGLTPQTFIGKTYAQLGFSPEMYLPWEAQIRQVWATKQVCAYEFEFSAPDGMRYLHSRLIPEFAIDGSMQSVLEITHDITENKLAEQALRAREAQLRQQAEELKQANQVKDEFLAVLSHELRSPLNAILGWSKLLQTRKFNADTFNRALETIERNAQLQTRLIEDLLDISRIIRGKLTLNPQPVNLETVITSALETVCLSAQTKGIELVIEGVRRTRNSTFDIRHYCPTGEKQATEYATFTTPIVIGEPSRLQQIVWNLLSNAIKFTPSGGRVEVQLSRVTGEESGIGSRESGANDRAPHTNYAQITVKDTGIGISPEFLPYIFDYFRQADASITRSYGGLGLGLAIVRHLVELHGGTVRAESLGIGQGATFRVLLPLLETTAEFGIDAGAALGKRNSEFGIKDTPLPRKGTQLCAPTDSPLTNIRILVLEDDRDTREFLTLTLEEYGAQPTTVDSVAAALEVLGKSLPDILVSDIGMPEEDGYSFIRQVRALPSEQGGLIPAIALTAYAREQDRDRAIAAGFQRHLAKPIVPDELVQAIAQLIGE